MVIVNEDLSVSLQSVIDIVYEYSKLQSDVAATTVSGGGAVW